MTEARRIVALAAAFDIPIIPHGSSIYSYHLQICFPNCPMAEFLVMSPKADSIGESYIIIDQNLRTSNNFDLTKTYDLSTSLCFQFHTLEIYSQTSLSLKMAMWNYLLTNQVLA